MPALGLGVMLQQFLHNKIEDIDPVAATANYLIDKFSEALLEDPGKVAGLDVTDVPLGRGGAVATAAKLGLAAGDAGMMHLANSSLSTYFTPDERYKDTTAQAYARNAANAYRPQRAKKHSIPKVNKPNKVRGI